MIYDSKFKKIYESYLKQLTEEDDKAKALPKSCPQCKGSEFKWTGKDEIKCLGCGKIMLQNKEISSETEPKVQPIEKEESKEKVVKEEKEKKDLKALEISLGEILKLAPSVCPFSFTTLNTDNIQWLINNIDIMHAKYPEVVIDVSLIKDELELYKEYLQASDDNKNVKPK